MYVLLIFVYLFFFFFSSRRRHTRCSRDWSSDVCSSDLFAACLPRWIYCVLRLNSAHNFGNGDAELCQLVGFYPQPHRVLACAKYLNVADAGRARDRIRDVDVCVVRQKVRVVRPMRRVQGKQHERSEEHTSELQSRLHLVCRLLLEKKNRRSDMSQQNTGCLTPHHVLR